MIDFEKKYRELQKKYQNQQKCEFTNKRKNLLYQAKLRNIIFILCELVLSLAPSENIENYVNKIKNQLITTKL